MTAFTASLRHRRTGLAATISVLAAASAPLALAVASAGDPGRISRRRCHGGEFHPRSHLRVVQISRRDGSGAIDFFYCYRGGAAHRLFRPVGEQYEDDVGHVIVVGRFLAYEATFLPDASAGAQPEHVVQVRRVRTARLVSTTDLSNTTLGTGATGAVVNLVLKPDGAVAWSERDLARGYPQAIGQFVGGRIVKRDAAATTATVLDQALADPAGASSIELGSLRLRGSTLFWRNGGGTQTATLY